MAIHPEKLIASARQVYGDTLFEQAYGGLVPTPAERVVEAADGQVIELGGRPLLLAHTPGHALHHLSVWDERDRAWFTGDVFGISYREFDVAGRPFAIPTTSPVQFDPEQMKASIQRLVAQQPERVHIAHYGTLTECARIGADLAGLVDAMASLAHAMADSPDRHARLVDALTALYVEHAERHGVGAAPQMVADVLGGDIAINAQGLGVWLDRIAKSRPS